MTNGNEPAGNEKGILAIGTLGGFLGFLIPLLVWAICKNSMSNFAANTVIGMTNFQLTLFIICFLLSFIPVLGWLICLVISIINLIIVILAFSAAISGKVYNYPFKFDFIK